MANKSKAKGNRFEREIAQLLSELVGDTFLRTQGSGGFVGGSNAKRKNILTAGQVKQFRGDIIPPDGVDLIVECKNYSNLQGGFHSIMSGDSKQLDEWLSEVRFDSENGTKAHSLFFKINGTNGKIFAVLPLSHFSRIEFDIYPRTYYQYFKDDIVFDYVIVETWVLFENQIKSCFIDVIIDKEKTK